MQEFASRSVHLSQVIELFESPQGHSLVRLFECRLVLKAEPLEITLIAAKVLHTIFVERQLQACNKIPLVKQTGNTSDNTNTTTNTTVLLMRMRMRM